MKDEVTRIMRLVKEGKLSPEDAAELIEAFNDSPSEAREERVEAAVGGEASSRPKVENPLGSLIAAIEGVAKDLTHKVDWKDVASQVRDGVEKGVDAVKRAAEEAKVGQGFGFLFGNTETKHVEMPLSVPEGKTLKIESSSGHISVEGSETLSEFRVKAIFRAASPEEAKTKASLYTPVIEETDQHVILKLQEGQDSHIDAVIVVKPGTPVEIRSASGKIIAKQLHQSLRVHGASASFTGTSLKGSLDVNLASGDIELSDCQVTLAALETKSGDIQLARIEGSLSIRTSSGDVGLREGSGQPVTVDAASGSVHLDFVRPIEGSVTVRAVSGDVTVAVPDGCDAKVSLSTIQGDARCDLHLEDQASMQGRIVGRLGSGNGLIDLSAVSGEVLLEMRGTESVEVPEPAEAPEAPEAPETPEAPEPPEPPEPPKPDEPTHPGS